jgi:hypothetical protein
MAADDVVAIWRAARAATDETLANGALGRAVTLTTLSERPLSAIVTLLVTDLLAHASDIAHALGHDPRIDADLITESFAWARDNVIRLPGFLGPELAPPPDADDQTRRLGPPDADEQTRRLAYLGRAAWQPVAA